MKQPQAIVSCVEWDCDKCSVKDARIAELEAVVEKLEKTKDDVVILAMNENEPLYCPQCANPVRQEFDTCYCDECVNPDGGDWPYSPPLPLFYTQCYADRNKAAEVAKRDLMRAKQWKK